jgi:formyltetrahydrofolate deformylase
MSLSATTSATTSATSATAILQVICPDRPALVSELSGWVAVNGGNIRHADHHTDLGAGLFLSRIEWALEGFGLPRQAIVPAVAALAERLGGEGQVHFSDELPRVAIFVSKQDHCLVDLLWRTRAGELPMTVPLVVSNHPDLREVAEGFGATYAHVPVSGDSKEQAEQAQLQLLADHQIELVVLAKYMQVLSPSFLERFPRRGQAGPPGDQHPPLLPAGL